MISDPLRDALQELTRELLPHEIKLIIGGGYGLVLRAQYIRTTGIRTLREVIPSIRGTEDIDCFLKSELITDGTRTEVVRATLDRLGYKPVVKHLQFARTISHEGQQRTTKVDFLAAPVPPEEQSKVRVDKVRIRPRSFAGLHAHVTPEAFSVEEGLLAIDISDDGSPLFVYLPHPFSFLILKLFALRDRLGTRDSDDGKYHALDMLTIWAMITEAEWEAAQQFRTRFAAHPLTTEVRAILAQLFSGSDSPGTVALRDQARRQEVALTPDAVRAFITDLRFLLTGEEQATR